MAGQVEQLATVPGRVMSDHVIPAREYYCATVTSGQTIRVIDVEGQQVMDFVAYAWPDTTERLSTVWTNLLNGTWKITKGHSIYTNRSKPMFKIIEDKVQMNYTGGGFCTEESNFFRYGVRGTRNCFDNLASAFGPRGIQPKDLHEGSCFNIFMNVAYDPDGTCGIRPPISKAGDYIDLEAQMDVLAGFSNCPQERNPCNGFNPTPMRVIVYEKGGR